VNDNLDYKQQIFVLRCWQETQSDPPQWRFTVVTPLQESADLGFMNFDDVVDYLIESLGVELSTNKPEGGYYEQ
jgi:hypothetical protein